MKLFEEIFDIVEIDIILEAISDILYVSGSSKSRRYFNSLKSDLDKIISNLDLYKKNKDFFKCWRIYEETFQIQDKEVNLIIRVLNEILETHKEEELTTYVGADRNAIKNLIFKLNNFKNSEK